MIHNGYLPWLQARGRLRALGSSLRLKQRFGSGYQVNVGLNLLWNLGTKQKAPGAFHLDHC